MKFNRFKLNQRGSGFLETLLIIGLVMSIGVYFVLIYSEVDGIGAVDQAFRIGLDKLEEEGGLTNTTATMLYDFLSSKSNIRNVKITGSSAGQQYLTKVYLTISYEVLVPNQDNPAVTTKAYKAYSKTKVTHSRYVSR